VRHGATVWNATGRFQGHSDVELSPKGREQARAVAAALSTERIDRFYASDLQRAYETATIVAAPHGLPVTPDSRLREFEFGQWEGLTWAEIVADRPHLRTMGLTDAGRYRPEGGESFTDVTARVRAFLDELQSGEGQIVIVAHAGPLHAALDVLGVARGNDQETRRSFSPASLTRITMDAGEARLITLNDVRHLHSTG
jgi:broad specificity phosphatase PhoE